jgi:hypothetical protein
MRWPATPFLAKGWLGATPLADLGWTNHPSQLWGWSGHLQKAKKKLRVWGWPDHPYIGYMGRPLGWSNHLQKAKKQKIKKDLGFGGGRASPKGLGVVSTTPYSRSRGGSRPLGWSGHPKPLTFVFFLFFGLLGVAGPPPKPIGVAGVA